MMAQILLRKIIGRGKLEYYEIFSCEKCARAREKFFKSGIGKTLKKLIINNFNMRV